MKEHNSLRDSNNINTNWLIFFFQKCTISCGHFCTPLNTRNWIYKFEWVNDWWQLVLGEIQPFDNWQHYSARLLQTKSLKTQTNTTNEPSYLKILYRSSNRRMKKSYHTTYIGPTFCVRILQPLICGVMCLCVCGLGKYVPKPTFWRADRVHSAWYFRHWQELYSYGTPSSMISIVTCYQRQNSRVAHATGNVDQVRLVAKKVKFHTNIHNLSRTRLVTEKLIAQTLWWL